MGIGLRGNRKKRERESVLHKHIIINKDLSQEYAISCLVSKVCTKIDNNNNGLKQKETGSDVMDYLKNER